MSCREQNQNIRTYQIINNYLDAIWRGDINKAEQYISIPLDMGMNEPFDTLKQQQMMFENRQSMKRQQAFFLKKYPQKPDINVTSISETGVHLLGKKELKTGILLCTVELKNNTTNDTCILLIYNGLEATQAKIAQIVFKNKQMPFLEIRTQ